MMELGQKCHIPKNSDLSTTYLGRIDMTRSDKIKEGKDYLYQNKAIQ